MSVQLRDVRPVRPPDGGGNGGGRKTVGTVMAVALLVAGFTVAHLASGPRGTGGETPGEGRGEPGAEAPVGTSSAPPPVPGAVLVRTRDTLGWGQTLGDLLGRHGLAVEERVTLLELLREHQNPRRLQPGVVLESVARIPERVSGVSLVLDRDRTLRFFADVGGEGWRVRLDSVPVTVDTLRVGGVMRTSLWNATLSGDTARLAPNEDREILSRLTEIYQWQVDFFRDIRSGDHFRALIEREVRPDGTLRSATMLAVEFWNDGRYLPAVRFVIPGGTEEYYDASGEATRKAFLRAPLRFGRQTSGFSRRRFHPVLKYDRPHLGVDYGARRGTPVLATGSGVVTRAQRWGGYGRMVEIRHTRLYRTRYAHLNGFARGVRPGVRVEQGEVIGYVGSTGLATAPHVHYEFLVSGSQRNPARVELPPGQPVPQAWRETYRGVRDERLALLAELERPLSGRLARETAGGATGRAVD